MTLSQPELRDFLDAKVAFYNQPAFIASDPVSIPHAFSAKEDIEIAAFFAATFAWGQRLTIINKSKALLSLMENAPADFVKNHEANDLKAFANFKHRTFNFEDLQYFLRQLKRIYKSEGGLENAFCGGEARDSLTALRRFQSVFFGPEAPGRTRKHVSNPDRNSSCKRLNMFLRWMVRQDQSGVDFGLWKGLSPAQLSCPLDLHSGRVARKLGLVKRTTNDWKAVTELDANLRALDPKDPVKYDFALFGLGVFEKF